MNEHDAAIELVFTHLPVRRIIPNNMFGLTPVDAIYGDPCRCGYGFLARHDSGLCEWCTAGLPPGRQYRSYTPRPFVPRPRTIDYTKDAGGEESRNVARLIPPPRPDMRHCHGCWRAALHTDVRRFVHEIAPCYPGCQQDGDEQ